MNTGLLALVLIGLGSGHCNGASIYPVCEAADLVSDDRLPGTWWSGSDEGWILEPVGVGRYMARWFNMDDTTTYELLVAKVDAMRLADLRPPELGDRYDLVRLHWYSRLNVTDGQVTVQPLRHDWVEKYVQAHPQEIAHLTIDGAVIFTASPRELQRFLRRHWKDADAWDEVTTLSRTRPEE